MKTLIAIFLIFCTLMVCFLVSGRPYAVDGTPFQNIQATNIIGIVPPANGGANGGGIQLVTTDLGGGTSSSTISNLAISPSGFLFYAGTGGTWTNAGSFTLIQTNVLQVNTNIVFITGAGNTNVNLEYFWNATLGSYTNSLFASIYITNFAPTDWELLTNGTRLYQATLPVSLGSQVAFPYHWMTRAGATAPSPRGFYTNQNATFNAFVQSPAPTTNYYTQFPAGISAPSINVGTNNTLSIFGTVPTPSAFLVGSGNVEYGYDSVFIATQSSTNWDSLDILMACNQVEIFRSGSDTAAIASEFGIVSNQTGVTLTLAAQNFTNNSIGWTIMGTGLYEMFDTNTVLFFRAYGSNTYDNVAYGFSAGANQTNVGTGIYDVGDTNNIVGTNIYVYGNSNTVSSGLNMAMLAWGMTPSASFANSGPNIFVGVPTAYIDYGTNVLDMFGTVRVETGATFVGSISGSANFTGNISLTGGGGLSTANGSITGASVSVTNGMTNLNTVISNYAQMYQLVGYTNNSAPTVATNGNWSNGTKVYFTNMAPSDMRAKVCVTPQGGTVTNWFTFTYGHTLSNVPAIFISLEGNNSSTLMLNSSYAYIASNTTSFFTVATPSFTSSAGSNYIFNILVVQ